MTAEERAGAPALTLIVLQQALNRALARGFRPNHRADFASAMAAMRDQGRDPYTQPLTVVVGPYQTLGADSRTLERYVFRVPGGLPWIEIEVELPPGSLPRALWEANRDPSWRASPYTLQ